MDSLFSSLAGLVASLILLPGPLLPDVSGLSAADAGPRLTLEQRFFDPATMPDFETLLTLPTGFRAAGFDAMILSRNSGN
jgi:hypothetical protein